SNGKGVNKDGESLDVQTGGVIWGGPGTNGQHAYHQLLHQGTALIPVDFIFSLKTHNPLNEHHTLLIANCLSQSRALMVGKTLAQAQAELLNKGCSEQVASTLAPHKVIPGNRPSNTLVLDELNPNTLGALIALYEHKVFTQSVLWGINAFDQWGVELGKQLSDDIYRVMARDENGAHLDASTAHLIDLFKNAQSV
ncbi:MAG TPA: glucose-6-phosphate isomerase, partial [Pseudomonadales bacterium]|nr:glucose-6-phosphate isomerase [Pseudomonadales bacterium]